MRQTLWPGIAMPDWDADLLFDLFTRRRAIQLGAEDRARLKALEKRQASKTAALVSWEAAELADLRAKDVAAELPAEDADRFARLLMMLTESRFGFHDYHVSLRKRGLDPHDVAAAVLATVLRRTKAMTLKHPCVKVMLDNLHQLIRCAVLDYLRRDSFRTLFTVTDLVAGDASVGSGPSPDRALTGPTAPDLDSVERRLLALEETITDDLVADPEAVSRAFRVAVASMLRQQDVLLEELPGAVGKLSHDVWLLIRLRLARALEGTLEEAPPPAWVDRQPPAPRMRWKVLFELFGNAAPAVARRVAEAVPNGLPESIWPSLTEVGDVVHAPLVVRALERDPSTESVGRLASHLGVKKRDVARMFRVASGLGIAEARRGASVG